MRCFVFKTFLLLTSRRCTLVGAGLFTAPILTATPQPAISTQFNKSLSNCYQLGQMGLVVVLMFSPVKRPLSAKMISEFAVEAVSRQESRGLMFDRA